MINDSTSQELIILDLYEVLFQHFGIHQIIITNLHDLLNEFNVVKILEEIEPELLSIAELDEIKLIRDNQHNNFSEKNKNNKISNFVEIVNCLSKFFSNCPTKNKLKDNFKIKNMVRVNELLKNINNNVSNGSNTQTNITNSISSKFTIPKDLIIFGEVLLVLSAVSTKRTEYLDHLCVISESEEKYLNNYLTILEKYLVFQEETQDKVININANIIRKTQKEFTDRRKDNSYNFKQRITMYDKDKNEFLKSMEAYEKEISDLNKKNEELTDELLELEMKNRDTLRENDSLKYSNSKHYQMEQDSYNDVLIITQLKNELMKKELEIEDIKREHELNLKRLRDDIVKINTVNDRLEDKLDELKNVKFENEKFKLKIKELNLMKEKFNECEHMSMTIEIKNRQIENLIKEKQNFIQETDNLIKDNFTDKERIKKLEFEKKKLEYDIFDLKKEFKVTSRRNSLTLNNLVKSGTFIPIKSSNNNNQFSNFNNLQNFNANINSSETTINRGIILEQVQDMSNYHEEIYDRDLETELNELQAQYEDLNILHREQIEINHKLNEEKSDHLKLNDKFKHESDVLKNEKEKILIEKEKVEISRQKIELELNKSYLNIDKIENEKVKVIDEVNKVKEKNKMLLEEKNDNIKDSESIKVLLKMKNNQIDKLLSEKQKLIDDHHKLNLKFEKFKNEKLKEINIENSLNTSMKSGQNGQTPINQKLNTSKFTFNNSNNSKIASLISPKNSINSFENAELKAEISQLKTSILNKDDSIKTLKERVKHLEKVESIIKLKENKVQNDMQHYKKSYEEQKFRMNQEHEVLSNNLCDLAMQFMVFKNELLKNVKPSILKTNNSLMDSNGGNNYPFENDDDIN